MNYLLSISVAFALLFSLLLITKKEKQLSDYFLSFFFGLIGYNILFLITQFQDGMLIHTPFGSEFHFSLAALHTVSLWFYAKTCLDPQFKLKPAHLWHLVPFALYLSTTIIPLVLKGVPNGIAFKVFSLTKMIIHLVYLIAVYRMLRRHKHPSPHLSWMKSLIIGGLILWGSSVLGSMANVIQPNPIPFFGYYYVGTLVGIYLFVLGYIAFQQSSPFSPSIEHDPVSPSLPPPSEDSHTYTALVRFMDREKPYLDPTLNLHKLAELSAIPSSKLSRTINHFGQVNFYDFVNAYRVETVKEKIQHGELEHLSMLGLAMDSGFNSKASFNRIFKKHTGLTPSAYKKQLTLALSPQFSP